MNYPRFRFSVFIGSRTKKITSFSSDLPRHFTRINLRPMRLWRNLNQYRQIWRQFVFRSVRCHPVYQSHSSRYQSTGYVLNNVISFSWAFSERLHWLLYLDALFPAVVLPDFLPCDVMLTSTLYNSSRQYVAFESSRLVTARLRVILDAFRWLVYIAKNI